MNDDTTVTISRSLIASNDAKDGVPGGRGIGGGVYRLGLFLFDADSSIRKNRASTSHNEIFS